MKQRFTTGHSARIFAPALVLALVGAAAALTGCGQKGPLFLPGQNPNPPTPLLDDDDSGASAEGKPADAPASKPEENADDTPADVPAPN